MTDNSSSSTTDDPIGRQKAIMNAKIAAVRAKKDAAQAEEREKEEKRKKVLSEKLAKMGPPDKAEGGKEKFGEHSENSKEAKQRAEDTVRGAKREKTGKRERAEER
jgi:hypothetical protein